MKKAISYPFSSQIQKVFCIGIMMWVLTLFFSGNGWAQDTQMAIDTAYLDLTDPRIKDPKKATILSAVLPGAGQVYNNKAWKVPLLYAGFATNIYFIEFNNRRYQLFRSALIDFDNGLPNQFPNLNRDGLVRRVNFWRRNRDLNYFLFVGIYALNIVDAQVDAHLSGFDVSEDLTFRFEPVFENLMAGGNLFGLSLKINF